MPTSYSIYFWYQKASAYLFYKKERSIPSSPNDAWKASVFPFFEDVTREKKHTRPTQLNIQPLEQAAEKSGFFQSQEAALQANLLLMSV